jgi:hypothetical protein
MVSYFATILILSIQNTTDLIFKAIYSSVKPFLMEKQCSFLEEIRPQIMFKYGTLLKDNLILYQVKKYKFLAFA